MMCNYENFTIHQLSALFSTLAFATTIRHVPLMVLGAPKGGPKWQASQTLYIHLTILPILHVLQSWATLSSFDVWTIFNFLDN